MRIGIDARQMVINERGISTYIYHVLRHLLAIDSKNEYVLYINSAYEYAMDGARITERLGAVSSRANVTVKDIRSGGFMLWEQIYLPLLAA